MNIEKKEQKFLASKIFNTRLLDSDEIAGLSWSELHSTRSNIRKNVTGFFDQVKKENRDIAEDEERGLNAVEAVLDLLQEEFETRCAEGRKEPRLADQPYRANVKPKGSEITMTEKIFAPRKRWVELYGREPRNVEGIKNIGEIIQGIHTGDETKIRELRTISTITGTEGGFAIPEVMWSEIYDSGLEASRTLDLVTSFPMTGNSLIVPGWDSADKTLGPIGEIEGEWLGEESSATRKTPKLTTLTFNSNKLALYTAASSEALMDSEALSMSISPLLRNSLAFSLDSAVLTGSGIARPLGILNSPAMVAVNRAVAGTVGWTDISGMVGRFLPSSLPKAVFLVSPSVYGVLFGMEVSGSSGILVMQNGRIQMIPVRITEKLPSIASRGSICLVDLSYYGLALREVARFEKTNASQWLQDVIDFRLIIRGDGKPLISKPFTPAGGGSTLSPFVCVDE